MRSSKSLSRSGTGAIPNCIELTRMCGKQLSVEDVRASTISLQRKKRERAAYVNLRYVYEIMEIKSKKYKAWFKKGLRKWPTFSPASFFA